jgi:hypothetical protein
MTRGGQDPGHLWDWYACVPLIRARDRRCSRDALRTPCHTLKGLASLRTTRSRPEKFTVILPSFKP